MGREANPKMILIDFLEMFNVRPGALSKIYLSPKGGDTPPIHATSFWKQMHVYFNFLQNSNLSHASFCCVTFFLLSVSCLIRLLSRTMQVFCTGKSYPIMPSFDSPHNHSTIFTQIHVLSSQLYYSTIHY